MQTPQPLVRSVLLRLSIAAVTLAAAAGPALAVDCTAYPYVLANGQTTNASNLMDNFACARDRLNTLVTTIPATPQGRLTLTSGEPVMTSNGVADATKVYYTPYVGNRIPIRASGTPFTQFTFEQLELSTDGAGLTANSLYDVFVFSNAGVLAIGFGPAWATSTARGTGAGTTELQLFDGLWTNDFAIILKNGPVTHASIAQTRATYVGTVALTAAGKLAMQFRPGPTSGGNNTWLGVWNAYNRTTVRARSTDAASSWTYNSTAFRAANGSANNRVNWVDGLSQSQVVAQFNQTASTPNNNGASAALGWDSTTVAPGSLVGTTQNSNTSAIVRKAVARDAFIALGLHYVQALESAPSGTPTFYGSSTAYPNANTLEVKLEM